jgi:hypothetical protein
MWDLKVEEAKFAVRPIRMVSLERKYQWQQTQKSAGI